MHLFPSRVRLRCLGGIATAFFLCLSACAADTTADTDLPPRADVYIPPIVDAGDVADTLGGSDADVGAAAPDASTPDAAADTARDVPSVPDAPDTPDAAEDTVPDVATQASHPDRLSVGPSAHRVTSSSHYGVLSIGGNAPATATSSPRFTGRIGVGTLALSP